VAQDIKNISQAIHQNNGMDQMTAMALDDDAS
jgi:hypothetical protein